jgi:iron complex transport system substrate-binding protein
VRILILLLYLASRAATAEVSAVDSFGRRVSLPAPASRIASLAPHATEQVFAAGAGARIVAVSEYSDYPPEAKQLPRASNFAAVNVEQLLALKPDLVVVWRVEATAAALQRLESLGLNVFYSEPRRLAEIPDIIEAIGQLAGTSATAAPVARALRLDLARLEQAYRARRPVPVFYQISESPLMTLGGQHFVSDAIALCGGRNVFADIAVMAPIVNIEAVMAADPEAIIAGRPDPSDTGWHAFWGRFPGLRAVRAANLFAVPVNEMHRHGPRAFGAAEQLCERIDEARRKPALKAASPR